MRKSVVLPAAVVLMLTLGFPAWTLLASRGTPAPGPSPFVESAALPAAGCTFDVDLPRLAERDPTTRDTTWVDCERLLPPLELTWSPPGAED